MSRLDRERAFHDQRYSHDSRSIVDALYEFLEPGRDEFARLAARYSVGLDVLEIGCGRGAKMARLCQAARSGVAIDISPVAIERAREVTEDPRWSFVVMNAERTNFESSSFDLVIGTGVIHHLDIGAAFEEVRRVLKPDGKALFLEPLGYNPVLNMFRRRTPHLRSPDERPLRKTDLTADGLRFVTRQYGLVSPLLSLGPTALGSLARKTCSVEVKFLCRLPGVRWLAWYALLELSCVPTVPKR